MKEQDLKDLIEPPWMHLLSPMQRVWREKQILKGRNPDSYIRSKLEESGDWPQEKEKQHGKD